jgi:hypothetical protein
MNGIGWWMVGILARTLAPDERDAVCGDLAESGESGGHALRDVLGLVARRQAALWKDWRPWLAPLALAAPVVLDLARSSGGLTGVAWVGVELRTLWTYGVRYEAGLPAVDDWVTLLWAVLLPIAWAFTTGYAAGALARRTAWLHPVLIFPPLWCAVVFVLVLASGHLSMIFFYWLPQVALILIPFLWGAVRGARGTLLPVRRIAWLAAALALLILASQIEDGRSSLALAAWQRGRSIGGRLAWTPQLLPFAAAAWQFGLIFVTQRFKENPA